MAQNFIYDKCFLYRNPIHHYYIPDKYNSTRPSSLNSSSLFKLLSLKSRLLRPLRDWQSIKSWWPPLFSPPPPPSSFGEQIFICSKVVLTIWSFFSLEMWRLLLRPILEKRLVVRFKLVRLAFSMTSEFISVFKWFLQIKDLCKLWSC